MTKIIETRDATLSLEGRVAILRLDRDDVRNALTGTGLIDDIERTATWVNETTEVGVLVITGAGAAFSAGGNIKEMRDRKGSFAGNAPELEESYRRGIQRIPLALDRVEAPTVAAINGPAIGAGCDLACMCDLRIGSSRAVFGETFVNLGIIPGDGGGWLLQRLIGAQRAAELTFTGRTINADEAREIGLLLEVVDPEALMARTLEIAGQIASKPPQAVRYAKRLFKVAQRTELRDYLDFCATVQGICHGTQDHLEAVNAFLDKRTPRFIGA